MWVMYLITQEGEKMKISKNIHNQNRSEDTHSPTADPAATRRRGGGRGGENGETENKQHRAKFK